MTAYLVADVTWHDPEQQKAYGVDFVPIMEKYRGRSFRTGGSKPIVLEGEWAPRRVVIMEFPTMKLLQGWYHSKEYAPLIRIRKQGATTNIIAVEGSRIARPGKRPGTRKSRRGG